MAWRGASPDRNRSARIAAAIYISHRARPKRCDVFLEGIPFHVSLRTEECEISHCAVGGVGKQCRTPCENMWFIHIYITGQMRVMKSTAIYNILDILDSEITVDIQHLVQIQTASQSISFDWLTGTHLSINNISNHCHSLEQHHRQYKAPSPDTESITEYIV